VLEYLQHDENNLKPQPATQEDPQARVPCAGGASGSLGWVDCSDCALLSRRL